MKKILLIWILSVSGITVFASPESKIPSPIVRSFQQSFAAAKEVNWSVTNEVIKVDFVFNAQNIKAYYDGEGNLLGLGKNILSTDLPVFLSKNLKDSYKNYWISEVMEYSTKSETTYYVVVENADKKLVLQSSGNSWSIVKKADK